MGSGGYTQHEGLDEHGCPTGDGYTYNVPKRYRRSTMNLADFYQGQRESLSSVVGGDPSDNQPLPSGEDLVRQHLDDIFGYDGAGNLVTYSGSELFSAMREVSLGQLRREEAEGLAKTLVSEGKITQDPNGFYMAILDVDGSA